MATLGKLVMGLFLDSSQAESGLDKAKKKTTNTAAAMQVASKKTKGLDTSLKGLATAAKIASGIFIAQAAFSTATTVADQFAGIIEAGANLETTAIKFAYLTSSWDTGIGVLKELRQASTDAGIPLQEMTAGFTELVTAGLDAKTSVNTVKEMADAAQLLGDQGKGIRMLTGTLASLQEEGHASQASLKGLQDGGLKVYQALADYLTKVTGKAHTTRDALFALKNGAVVSASAITAIQMAAKSPEVKEAAQRFAASFEGQKARLIATFNDVFAIVGKGIIDKLKLPEIMSGIRGAGDMIGKMIESLIEKTGGFLDPKNLAKGVGDAFKQGQILALAIAETITQGAVQAAKILAGILEQMGNMNAMAMRAAWALQNPIKAAQHGAAVAMAEGMGNNALANQLAVDNDKAIGIPKALREGNNAVKMVNDADKAQKKFFDEMRNEILNGGGEGLKFKNADEGRQKLAGLVGMARGLFGGNIQQNVMGEPMNFGLNNFIKNDLPKIGEKATQVGQKFNEFAAAMEKVKINIAPVQSYIEEVSKEVRNPLEAFQFEMAKSKSKLLQLAPVIEKMQLGAAAGNKDFQGKLNQLQTIFLRQQGSMIQGLLQEYSPAQNFGGSAAAGGSTAAVESLVRNAYSESNMDPQARIEVAIKRGNMLAERNLQYQARLIQSLERSPATKVLNL